MEPGDEQAVQTTETTFEIIQVLKDSKIATLSTIARELGMSKSTVRNHLLTLDKHGYVVNTDDGFRLSLEFLDIGERVRGDLSIYEPAKEVIDELAEKTGEKSQLMVEQNGIGYYIYRSKGRQGVNTRAGRRTELHCTSAGKAALAFMDRTYVEQIIENRDLPRHTDNTITDREAFFEELDTIRERGYAFNDEERLRGLRAVGAPVLSQDEDEVLGSISLSGPTTRLRGERFMEELPKLVMQSADVVNIRAEYS